MKTYTDLEQSKKLAEILPFESADLFYVYDRHLDKLYGDTPYIIHHKTLNKDVAIPCWSLSALMNIIEEIEKVEICFNCSSNKYWVDVFFETFGSFCQDHELYDSKIDALIALIKKLKKRNLL